MADDIRLTRWDLTANAGLTQQLVFTADAGLTSLSVYTGGTLLDVDDLTGATEYAGTLSTTTVTNDTATVSLVVGSDRTPLRLVVDGAVQTIGSLTPSSIGTDSSDSTISLTAGANTFTLSVLYNGLTEAGTQTLTNKTLNSFTNYIEADAIHLEVRNDSGAEIPAGTPVYVTGYNNGQELATVGLADASSAATMPAIGLTTEAIANNTNGSVESLGRLTGLDTSTWAVGDELYVDTTAGVLVNTPPNTTAKVQKVATVLRSHASLGVIDVGVEATAAAYASTTTYGIARFATPAEVDAGTATDRVLAPADLASLVARVAALEAG